MPTFPSGISGNLLIVFRQKMPSVSYNDIRALGTLVHLSVPDKLQPGLPLPWHQEFMTALSQASNPCLSYVWCAGDFIRAWTSLLCSDPVGLDISGMLLYMPLQGMVMSPPSASLCPWSRMRKYQQSCNLLLCDRTDK